MPNVDTKPRSCIEKSATGIAIAVVAGLPFSNQHIGSCAFYDRITAKFSTLHNENG